MKAVGQSKMETVHHPRSMNVFNAFIWETVLQVLIFIMYKW